MTFKATQGKHKEVIDNGRYKMVTDGLSLSPLPSYCQLYTCSLHEQFLSSKSATRINSSHIAIVEITFVSDALALALAMK